MFTKGSHVQQMNCNCSDLIFICLAFFAGHCWQHLRGGLGLFQAWHIVWDQRAEGAETPENFQDHQVKMRLFIMELNYAHVVALFLVCVCFTELFSEIVCDFFLSDTGPLSETWLCPS